MKKIISFLVFIFFSLNTVVHANPDTSLIVGYGPGGTDTLFRVFAKDTTEHGGLKLTVENRAGANGVLAIKSYLQKQSFDNEVLGVTGGQTLFEAITNPENNFIEEFKFIGPVLKSPLALAVSSNGSIKSLEDLFDKSKPRRVVNIAVGGEFHRALATLIAKHSHHDVRAVMYKGGADANVALKGGHVDAQVDVYGWFIQQEGIKILGVAQKTPLESAPSLDPYIPNINAVNFWSIAVSKKVQNTQKIEQAIRQSYVKNNRTQYWNKLGYQIDDNLNSDYVQRVVIPEYNRWKKILVDDSNKKK